MYVCMNDLGYDEKVLKDSTCEFKKPCTIQMSVQYQYNRRLYIQMVFMKDKEILKLIKEARDVLIKARNINCTCSGFVLQYEGCLCGASQKVIAAEKHLWRLIEQID